jgi:uncharacterized membrane protein
MPQLARPLFILLLVVAAVLISATVGQLPAQIASHFGASGAPNGWMDRNGYRLFMLAFAVGIPLLVVLSMTLLPGRMLNGINIPNRDYWLAPDRREATLRYIATHAYWLGSLLVIFIAAIHLLLIEANRTQPPHLPGALFGTILATFLAAMGVWMVTIIMHFRHKG